MKVVQQTTALLILAKDSLHFNALLHAYVAYWLVGKVLGLSFVPAKIAKRLNSALLWWYTHTIKPLDRRRQGSVSELQLIKLAIRNMQVKKTRTMITIGGMAVGISSIVLLVSIGYGLQDMVITRIARLEEMSQAEVSQPPGSKLAIDDKTLSDFAEISGVDMVLPLIGVVGRVSYERSVTDVAVYGVTSEYLESSAIKPFWGKIFESEMRLNRVSTGLELENKEIALVEEEVSEDDTLVLGETTEASVSAVIEEDLGGLQIVSRFENGVEWIEIASISASASQPNVEKVSLGGEALQEAVVNKAMMRVLGISEAEAVGKTFEVSFVITNKLQSGEGKTESFPSIYTIVGVTPDDATPIFYVPFGDLRSLGIDNYSQVKVVVENQDDLSRVRENIEALGFNTTSVVDTVAQVTKLFSSARTVLAALGMFALAVAALGMFNTLTVSLLERTREVGLMKAMGMKSENVKKLFLTESMIMGVLGGLLGLLVGFVLGELLSLGISIFALLKGVGYVNISSVPLGLILGVMLLSITVGFLTGLYPARRATTISALDALRYE